LLANEIDWNYMVTLLLIKKFALVDNRGSGEELYGKELLWALKFF